MRRRCGSACAGPARPGRGAHAGDHLVLADVDPGTPLHQHVHVQPPPSRPRWTGPAGPTDQRRCEACTRTTVRGAGKAPGVNLITGLTGTKRERAQPAPAAFSSHEAAPTRGDDISYALLSRRRVRQQDELVCRNPRAAPGAPPHAHSDPLRATPAPDLASMTDCAATPLPALGAGHAAA